MIQLPTSLKQVSNLYVGLLSGTSVDGIDAALIHSDNNNITLMATHQLAYPTATQQILLQLLHGDDSVSFTTVATLDAELGNHFAQACLELLDNANVATKDVMAIGCHGQTIRHCPNADIAYTLQIGDPNRIAEHTQITTVADFRRRDIAAGGQGAPLVPAFHQAVFADPTQPRVVANIGGIANIAVLTLNKPIIGFDTGPGNTLLDAWSQHKRRIAFDKNGSWAASGTCCDALLDKLLSLPFFCQQPPKSTGPELFNLTWLQTALADLANDHISISDADVQATLTELTAISLCNAAITHTNTAELILCGGGTHNRYLCERIQTHWPNRVCTSNDYGVAVDWVEAMAFAWLAQQTLQHQPGNVPNVTGATHPCVLGGIYPA